MPEFSTNAVGLFLNRRQYDIALLAVVFQGIPTSGFGIFLLEILKEKMSLSRNNSQNLVLQIASTYAQY